MEGKKYFVYGTLMDPLVLTALGLEVVTSEPAIMPESTLYKANSGRFPFLVKTHDPRDNVKGLLVTLQMILPTTKHTVDDILDYYEGAYGNDPLYNRKEQNGVIYYEANRGNPHVIRQLTIENHIGGDWLEFSKQSKV